MGGGAGKRALNHNNNLLPQYQWFENVIMIMEVLEGIDIL